MNEDISDRNTNIMSKEVLEKIERVYDMFDTSFITPKNELILNKKWNVYFRLDNIYSPFFFDYKIISYLSYYTASNHFGKTTKECKWAMNKINRWFRHEFSYDDLQLIYCRIGCGQNEKLGIMFIGSGLDMTILKEDEVK